MKNSVKVLTSEPKENARPKPQPNQRILVVDDEVAIAEGIRSLLAPPSSNVLPFRRSSRSQKGSPGQQNGSPSFDVTVVHTPKSALEAVQRALEEGRPFAMGFFDVILGADIDGIELVRQIQALDPNLYAVFVTAYQDRSVDSIHDFLGSDKADRWDYINKPFTDGEILQKARNALSLWNLKQVKQWHEDQLMETQKHLLQNEKASTIAAIGRGVAHEFSNLLTQIVGNAELAILKAEPQRMKEALETILKASATANNVLNRFKKLTQGSENQSELQLVNLLLPVDETLDLLAHQLRKSNIEIVKERMDQVLIEANRHALIQVFMNILINAVHATGENGGRIYLAVEKADSGTAVVRIRDEGTGIPPDLMARVTDAFFTTKGALGSGLGLAVCKEIVEVEHSGQLQIENCFPKGILVTVKLPTRQ